MTVAGGWGGRREGAGRKPADYEAPPEKVDLDRERADHERVKRIERELNLSIKRKQYVSREAVRQASATALAILTQSLRSVPDNCERQFALDPEVVEAIQAQIDQALTEVAVAFKAMAPEPEAEPDGD